MYFALSGENIARAGRTAFICLMIGILIGCSGGDNTGTADKPVAEVDDRALVQQSLTEVITRWRYKDKAGLYDNEFPYLREKMSFDEYLQTKDMRMDADTVLGIEVKEYIFHGRDSVDVAVEVIFEGPKKIKTRMRDAYRMFFWDGKWIRPTLSNIDSQKEWEKMKKAYEEAVKEEEDSGN